LGGDKEKGTKIVAEGYYKNVRRTAELGFG
jgi:hypothetical protein